MISPKESGVLTAAEKYCLKRGQKWSKKLMQGDFMKDREEILQFQQTQQQMQVLLSQKQNLQMQSVEMENALEELGKNEKGDVFEVVGNIMIKKSSDEISKNLNEKKELMDLRLSTLDKQIEKLNEKATELQKKMAKKIKDSKKD